MQGVHPKAFPVSPSMAMPFYTQANKSAATKADKIEEETNLNDTDGETKKRKRSGLFNFLYGSL